MCLIIALYEMSRIRSVRVLSPEERREGGLVYGVCVRSDLLDETMTSLHIIGLVECNYQYLSRRILLMRCVEAIVNTCVTSPNCRSRMSRL